ncbi:response regulator [Candidatus Entotheonella palauensis]|uniref:response regulator n=1 Tax=Candidatus Entotheonella palauensis TaxID=93172 RepID=UPI0015C48D50|nr:response regulator [Candidatus Entotheonella palauensis]
MIVDDHECSRKVLAKKLERFEYNLTIDAVESGIDALALWRRQLYDLAFIDIVMPKLDGVALAQQLKKERQPWPFCPLIAYTAKVLEHERKAIMAKETGFYDFLSKPIQNDTLREMMRRWLADERIIGQP